MAINPNDVFPQALYNIYDGRYGQLSSVVALMEGQGSGFVAYATKAELDADLNHAANTPGMVMLDSTATNNCYYIKVGASGTGSWSKSLWPLRIHSFASEYVSLNAAVADANVTSLIIVGEATLTEDLSIPADIAVTVTQTGSINYGAYSLEILGPFSAGRTHCLVGTGALSVGYQNTTIYPEWVGVIPDTGANLSAGFTQLNKLLVGKRGADVIFSGGVYKSSVGLWINGYGITVRGAGSVTIEPYAAASNYILMLGNRESGSLSTSMRLVSSMTKGDTSAVITDVSGYEVGDIVFMFSDKSSNSTVNNRIPLYKQIFTINNIVGNALYFSSPAEVDFLVDADDTKTACILLPTATPAVGCKVENIHFKNDSLFLGPYLHGIFYAYNVELVNVRLDAYSSTGFVSFCDNIIYRNCELIGYNGFSCAAGTKSLTIDSCRYNNGINSQDYGGFFEESPERVYMSNSVINARVSCGSSADSPPAKQFIFRDCVIKAPGIAVRLIGAYNAEGYALDIDHCVFDAPGALGAASGNVRKTVIDITYIDSYRITNCEFKNADADSYAVDVGNVGTTYRDLYRNRYGTSLGPYTTADDNMLPYKTYTFTPTLTFGGASVGITYLKQRGTLTRFGNRAFYSIEIVLSAKGSSTGTAIVNGLSIASVNYSDSSFQQPGALRLGAVNSALTNVLQCGVIPNSTTINLTELAAGVEVALTNADFLDTSYILIAGVYEIAP
jgi:hypothetical protein